MRRRIAALAVALACLTPALAACGEGSDPETEVQASTPAAERLAQKVKDELHVYEVGFDLESMPADQADQLAPIVDNLPQAAGGVHVLRVDGKVVVAETDFPADDQGAETRPADLRGHHSRQACCGQSGSRGGWRGAGRLRGRGCRLPEPETDSAAVNLLELKALRRGPARTADLRLLPLGRRGRADANRNRAAFAERELPGILVDVLLPSTSRRARSRTTMAASDRRRPRHRLPPAPADEERAPRPRAAKNSRAEEEGAVSSAFLSLSGTPMEVAAARRGAELVSSSMSSATAASP